MAVDTRLARGSGDELLSSSADAGFPCTSDFAPAGHSAARRRVRSGAYCLVVMTSSHGRVLVGRNAAPDAGLARRRLGHRPAKGVHRTSPQAQSFPGGLFVV